MADKKRGRAKRPDRKAIAPAGAAAPLPALPAPAGDDPTTTLTPLGATPPAERRCLGRWVRGQSGNPKGRPKGIRNYVTRERLALEAALRSYISQDANLDKVLSAIDRLFAIAVGTGDKEAIAASKVLFDKLLTAPKDAGDQSDGPQQLTVVITQARGGDVPAVQVVHADDAEFDDVEEQNGEQEKPAV